MTDQTNNNPTLINETLNIGDTLELEMGYGETKEFELIAYINLDNHNYLILLPLEPFPGFNNDEAIIFEINKHENDQDSFDIVLDDKIIEEVTKEYIRLYS